MLFDMILGVLGGPGEVQGSHREVIGSHRKSWGGPRSLLPAPLARKLAYLLEIAWSPGNSEQFQGLNSGSYDFL